MRFTDDQKFLVQLARPEADLVRVEGTLAAVWHDPARPPAERWVGSLVSSIDSQRRVWFSVLETAARTRRALLEYLRTEALR